MVPKLSSSARKLRRELEAARPGTFDALEISLRSKLPDLTAVIERDLFHIRPRLLVELANMRDDGLARLRKTAAFFRQETDSFLLNVQGSLRRAWLRSTPLKEKQRLVNGLIASSFATPGISGWSAPLSLGRIVLDHQNLRSQLAVAILENWRRFAVCANPECPAPFFLSRRRTQKYCESGECTRYAQRERALAWWRREGNKWRAKRQKKRAHLRRKKISSSRKENK